MSITSSGTFAEAIQNKDAAHVEECLRKWSANASGNAEFSTLLNEVHQGNATSWLDETMLARVFQVFWPNVYSLAIQYEHDVCNGGGFAELIEATSRIMETIDQFESLLRSVVTFQHLRSHLLVCFARRWSHLAQRCNLDAQLRSLLPWKEVHVCLSWELISIWAYRHADEIRHELVAKVLELHRTVHLNLEGLIGKKTVFGDALRTCNANIGDLTMADQRLIRSLSRFASILTNPPARLTTGKKRGAANSANDFNELDTMNDIKSLRRILHYLSLAKSVHGDDPPDDADDNVSMLFLLVERVLQVTGECLKNTAGSKNLSDSRRQVLQNAGIPLATLTDLRNTLSHYNGLSARRKQRAERSFNVSLVFHDLDKLEQVFNKVLHRSEFNLLKNLIANEALRCGHSPLEVQLLDSLAGCRTLQEMEDRVHGHHPGTFAKQLQFLIGQFHVQSVVLKMEGPFALEGNKSNCRNISDIFQQLGVRGRAVSKSTITRVSEMNNLQMLLENVSFTAPTAQPGGLADDGDNLLKEFIDTVVKKHMSEEFYNSVSSELFLGRDFPVAKVTIETCLESYSDTDLKTPEDRAHTVPLLQLLDAVLHIQINSRQVGRNGTSDGFLDLIANARFVPVKTETVRQASEDVGLTDSAAQDVLLGMLLDMNGSAVEVDCEVDTMITKVIREKCSAGSASLLNGSKENNEIKSARLNLMAFLNLKINKESGGLTEAEFSLFKAKINAHLASTKNRKQLNSTFDRGSNRTWEPDLKLLKEMASPYEKLTTGLKKTKSLQESCAAFRDYLVQLDVPSGERDSALRRFRSLEQESLESFVSGRIAQLKQLLLKHEIPIDGTSTTLSDRVAAAYKRNHQLQAVVEMILLECIEIVANLYEPPANVPLVDRSLGNIPLRNYLAHGDALLDLYNPDVCRTILETAVELTTRGECTMALRKLFEEPGIFQCFQNATNAGTLHTIHAANVPGSVHGTLAKLQSIPDWETMVRRFMSNCVSGVQPLAAAAGMSTNLPTKLMSEDALHMLLANHNGQLTAVIQTNPRICQHRFKGNWTILHYAVFQCKDATGLIDLMVRSGADINSPDDQNVTPLHLAVLNHSWCNFHKLLQYPNIDVDAQTTDGVTPLHIAAQLGHSEILEALLKRGADPNRRSLNQWFPLHFASNCGHAGIVQLLLRYEARPNVPGSGKFTPLHFAIMQNHLDIAQVLLDHHADAFARLDNAYIDTAGRGVIHLAASYGSIQGLELLLNRGVAAHTKCSPRKYGYHRTPLHWATIYSRKELVELLVARPEVEKNGEDILGHTALDYALMGHYLPIAQFLLQQGCQLKPNILIAAARKGDVELLKILEAEGADCNAEIDSMSSDIDSVTPVIVAASYGKLEALVYLMDKTPMNAEALMYAACQNGRRNIVQFLIEEGHCPHPSQLFQNRKQAPLHTAAVHGRLGVVRYLVEECAIDKDAVDGDGNTPCMLAFCRRWNWAVANYLLENGADVTGEKGQNMLEHAARNGQWTVVRQLIDKGADFNVPWRGDDPDSSQIGSVAGIAACHGHIETLSHLIEDRGYNVQQLRDPALLKELARSGKRNVLHYLHCKGLDLTSAIDETGALGLHFAAAAGNVEVCEFFLKDLQVGIDVTNCDGWTALHHAVNGSQLQTVEYLLSRSADATRRTQTGETALKLAARKRYWPIMKCVMEGTDTSSEFPDELGNTLLHVLLKGARNAVPSSKVEHYIQQAGPALFHRNNGGNTVLHEAALQQIWAEVLQTILSKGKEFATDSGFKEFLNGTDQNQNSALMLYVKEWGSEHLDMSLRVVRVFLDHNADLNIQNIDRQTVLHLAVQKSSTDVLTALMEPLAIFRQTNPDGAVPYCIANPLLTDRNNMTPLMLAQNRADNSFRKFLLNYEAEYKIFFLKDEQELARIEAEKANYYLRLLERGPLHEPILSQDAKTVEAVLGLAPDLQFERFNDGQLPVHLAARVSDVTILQLLVSAGSDVNAVDQSLSTPLHIAAAWGRQETVEFLISKGAAYGTFNREGNKPVHVAIMAKHLTIVRYFFQNGLSDINDRNEEHESPMLLAARADFTAGIEYLLGMYDQCEVPLGNYEILNEAIFWGCKKAVQLLLDRGALEHIMQSGICPKSPLYMAVKNEQWSIAVQLLERASNAQLPFLLADQGPVLLNEAASAGQLDMVRGFIERGGLDPNSALETGQTPLIGAVYSNSKVLVGYLLDRNANPNAFLVKTMDTALHIAANRGYSEIARMLIDHFASVSEINDYRNPFDIASAKGHWDTAVIILNSAGSDQQLLFNKLRVSEQRALKTYAKANGLNVAIFTEPLP